MADVFYVAVTCVAIPLGGGLAAGWTANQWANITASWVDGCEQLAAWWTTCRRVLAPLAAAFAGWLRARVRPHGTHRRAVTQ